MPRIASIKPHPISVPLNDPVWTAHEELTSSSVIVVEVRTDDRPTGYGQIHGSPMKAICSWVERGLTPRGCYAGAAPPIVVRCNKRRWGMS